MAPAPEPPKSLQDATQQFEAILLGYLIRGLRQTIPGAEGAPFTRRFYDDLMDHYMATHLAKSGGIGLAKLIERSVPGTPADPAPADARPPTALQREP
ncbi:MAG: rod-binding protein [Candidatus Methylomirabilia bacterium]